MQALHSIFSKLINLIPAQSAGYCNGLVAKITWSICQLSTQQKDTFNNACNAAGWKFKLPSNNATKVIHFFRKSNTTSIWCMSSAFHKVQRWHSFRYGGLVHNHLCEHFSGFSESSTKKLKKNYSIQLIFDWIFPKNVEEDNYGDVSILSLHKLMHVAYIL